MSDLAAFAHARFAAAVFDAYGWPIDSAVGELLDRRQIDVPPIRQVSTTFRKAPKVKANGATLPLAME